MKKTIVIIGAGVGVGMAVAERFGKEDYSVALLARNEEKLKQCVNLLNQKGIQVNYYQADVLNVPSLINALNKIKNDFGSIDVVEFSQLAPMDTLKTPRNINAENMLYHINFLLVSAVAVVQHVLPDMLSRKKGLFCFLPHQQLKSRCA